LSSRRSGQPCGFLAADERTVWSASAHCDAWSGHGVVTRLDARTNRSTKIVSGLKAPIGLALGFGSLWVDDLDAKAIDRVDPRTGRLVARLHVGGIPFGWRSASDRSGCETTSAACCGSTRSDRPTRLTRRIDGAF
jgi:hypothetical protein